MQSEQHCLKWSKKNLSYRILFAEIVSNQNQVFYNWQRAANSLYGCDWPSQSYKRWPSCVIHFYYLTSAKLDCQQHNFTELIEYSLDTTHDWSPNIVADWMFCEKESFIVDRIWNHIEASVSGLSKILMMSPKQLLFHPSPEIHTQISTHMNSYNMSDTNNNMRRSMEKYECNVIEMLLGN